MLQVIIKKSNFEFRGGIYLSDVEIFVPVFVLKSKSILIQQGIEL